MPKYYYVAKADPNKQTKGEIEAASEQEAVSKLARMGLFPFSLRPAGVYPEMRDFPRLARISKKEIVIFTRQLSSLIESGVNIMASLNIILRQNSNKYFRSVLSQVISKIKDGNSLSESLRGFPRLFSGLYISMVHSGEAGGSLEPALKKLSDYLEKEEEFRSSVFAAMVYPLFILSVSILTVLVLLGFVIPRLVTMFLDMGQALPVPTKILITLSDFLRGFGWIIGLVLFAAASLFVRYYKTYSGKINVDRLRLRAFFLGKVVQKSEISRLMRILSVLLSSGLAIIQSLEIAMSVLTNEILRMEVDRFRQEVSAGASLSACLKGSAFFPEYVTNIVAIGEETGSIEKSLLRVADEYEKEVDRTLKTLTLLLEPAIILVMGCIVGFIVISMLLPIFQINLLVK